VTRPGQPPTGAPPVADDDLREALLLPDGPRYERALLDLHALLLRAARFEVARRASALAHVRGEDTDDLALQAADDAFVAVLAKLDDFRGDSRFSTWVYKFALYEAAVRMRRRAWQHREVVLDPDSWPVFGDERADPATRLRRLELLRAVRTLIDTELTQHQREVLVALTIQDIPIDVLAERLASTRGALYKTLHDARRKLRASLAAAGHDLECFTP
jgi:RNA polymerase sigma-70 factor (ECF subfamily)